jgi:hypothetical protein
MNKLTKEDAKRIAYLLSVIDQALEPYSEREWEDKIIVGIEDGGPNFFIPRLDEFLELGLSYTIQDSTFKEYPYEFIAESYGVEIRCIVVKEELEKHNIPVPEF